MADRTSRFLPLTALMCLLAAGCSSIPFVGGGDKSEVAEEAEENTDGRKPVLAIADELQPDPRFIGMLSAIELPPAFANADWTQPGGEADHVMHHLSGPENYSRAWKTSIGKSASKKAPVTTPPVIAENKVFTIDPEARVTAFDATSGARIWQKVLTPDTSESAKKFWQFRKKADPASLGFGGGVAYESGWLYLANGFGQAASLNATTGEVRWQVQLPSPVRNPPTAANGKLYIVTMDNQIVALDQTTGKQVWNYESFEESARVLSSGSPAVEADVVIAPFSSGEVVALDADTGRLLWSATIARSSRLNALSTLNDIAGSPVIDRGGVFAVSHAGQLAAIDARTGQLAWEINVSSRNTPWVAGDVIYLISVEGDLLALSRNDGAVIWREQLPAYENAKKRKGAISWSGPILAGDSLILTSSSGRLVQIDPQNGKTTETYKLSAGTIIPPVIAGGTLYVLTDKGQLEAWR